jgi:tetratricopeptide (TPR) repeat protein
MLCLTLGLLLAAAAADLESGRSLRREGRLDEAIQLFEELIASQSNLPEAYRELGHSLALAGRYQEAIEAYDELTASGEPRWELESIKWTGLTHVYLGEVETALARNERETELARELEESAVQARATWYRGHILTELGRYGEATDAFLETFDIDSMNLDGLHFAGLMAARQGDEGSLRYQIEDLQETVRRSGDPSQAARVYHLQAELALLQGQPKRALARIEEAWSLAPHLMYRETMARTHLALAEPTSAEAAYRDIITATDERLESPLVYIKALHGLARVLDASGQPAEALSFFEKFLAHWGEAPGPLPGTADARRRVEELRSPP